MTDDKLPTLLTPVEAADMLRITTATLARWDKNGKPVGAIRLPSGTRRYRRDAILKLAEGAR